MKAFQYFILVATVMISINLVAQEKEINTQNIIFKDVDGTVLSKNEFEIKYKDSITYHREYLMTRENGKTVFSLKKASEESQLKILNQEMIEKFFYKEIPEFSFTDTEGNKYTKETLKGKTVVLNFWFAKCAPCIKEIPILNSLAQDYSNNPNVVFIAITFDDLQTNKELLSKVPFNFRHVVDQRDLIDKLGVVSYPTNMVMDKKGRIILIESGYKEGIEKIIKEKL